MTTTVTKAIISPPGTAIEELTAEEQAQAAQLTRV